MLLCVTEPSFCKRYYATEFYHFFLHAYYNTVQLIIDHRVISNLFLLLMLDRLDLGIQFQFYQLICIHALRGLLFINMIILLNVNIHYVLLYAVLTFHLECNYAIFKIFLSYFVFFSDFHVGHSDEALRAKA